MLLISKDDIKKVFTMEDAIKADEKAFCYLSENKSVVPLRTNINALEGQSLFMPAYIESINAIAVKIISVFPKNIEKGLPSVPAKIVLLDGETGDVACIMDGTYVTQMRTSAAAGVATKNLANENAKVAAIFGTGGQAPSQLEAILTVRKVEEIRLFDINFDRCKAFAKEMAERFNYYGCKIIACESSERAVSDADIITTVTPSPQPVFDGRLLKKGCHVNGVGSYTPSMRELDEYLITTADKLYLDSRDAALQEAGDLLTPIKNGSLTHEKITGEIGELLLGKIKGRENSGEITVFKTVGTAVQDVVAAHEIYTKALDAGIGIEAKI